MAEYIVYESESVEVTDYLGGTHRVCHHEKREEIVRCRDCKYCIANVCMSPDGDGDYLRFEVLPDGFCAWGERK